MIILPMVRVVSNHFSEFGMMMILKDDSVRR